MHPPVFLLHWIRLQQHEPGAIIHACTLHDSCIVGANAQVLDGAVVESFSVVAPGSIVTPGSTVKSGFLYAGSPAREVRVLTDEEITKIADTAQSTLQLAAVHAVECAKDYKQLAEDEEEYDDRMTRADDYFPRIPKGSPHPQDVLGQGAPGRIFDTPLTNPEKAIEIQNKQK